MKNGGAWFNGETLYISQRSDINLPIAFAQLESRMDLSKYLSLSLGDRPVRLMGSPVLEFCHVALGSLFAYIDICKPPKTSLSEVAAGKLILEEAGGIVTDINGKLFEDLVGYDNAVNVIAVRERTTHEFILGQVRQVKE